MRRAAGRISIVATILSLVGANLLLPTSARGHCDTLDGPVVTTAAAALESGDVTSVLKWVKKEHEAEVHAVFEKALAVRRQSQAARELADRYFFETVVRLHREGEGAPFTGLKPAGSQVEAPIVAADEALVDGNVDVLVKAVTERVEAGIRARFTRTTERKRHAEQSVDAGREYVDAYVDFVHYVEALHTAAQGQHAHGDGAAPTAGDHAHHQQH